MNEIIPIERVESKIYVIRGQKVMLDYDLANLYGVETKALKRGVKRNLMRFPADFMFPLTREEYNSLRYQIGTLKKGEHSKYLPNAFIEQGVAMLSSVLRSERAIQVNIFIMRAFVKIKQALATHVEDSRKLKELEGRLDGNDKQITAIFDAIWEMVKPEKIGFLREAEEGGKQ